MVLLLGVFLADTTVTLVRRLLRGAVVWEAHREHFYQRAVAVGWGHARVTVTVIVASIMLSVFATFEVFRVGPGWLWIVLGLSLLAVLAIVVVRQERRVGTAREGS